MKYPLKISFQSEIIPLLIIIISFALGIYFYQHFPEQVVTHWDFEGKPDGYSGKFFGALGLPFILLGLYFLLLFLPVIDPKRERYVAFQKIYHMFKIVFLSVLFAVFLASGLYNLGYKIPMNFIASISVGFLIVFLGNFMGKIKSNWFIGIRTPWTLSSENVWNKTHRLGGWLFVILGFLLILSPFLNDTWGIGISVLGALTITVVVFVYSYLLYRKEKSK